MTQNSIWTWSRRGCHAGFTLGLAALALTVHMPRVASGQEQVRDFNQREVGSEPHLITWSDSSIVFAATTKEYGKEIWRYDLASGVSSLVLDHTVGEVSSFFRRLMAVNQNIAFLDYDKRLWGFEAGTLEAVELAQSSMTIYGDPVEFNGRLYFSAFGDDRKSALWYSDGTEAGTGKADFGEDTNEFFYDALVFGDSLYVVRATSSSQTALWAAADPLLGFRKVSDLGNVSTRNVDVVDSLMFFFTSGSTISLWESDGTTAGTVRKFSWQEVQSNPDVYGVTPIDSGFVFVPGSQQYPFEPFYTDGTLEGITLLKDIMPGSVGSFPEDFVSTGSIVVFFPWTIEEGYTIWGTDGTSQGTIQLGDQRPGPQNFYCGEAISFNGKIFFTADDGINGWELWESDGTPEGTHLFLDVSPGATGSRVEELLVAGGHLWFVASGPSGRELWSSDGTVAGTEVVTELRDGVTGSGMGGFLGDSGANFLFRAGDGWGTTRLFGIDHTDDSLLEFDLGEDPAGGRRGEWLRNALYFTTSRPYAIWLSDGTVLGTIRLDTLDNDNPQLTEFGDHVYYYRADGEIWRTDGTRAGSEHFWTRDQGQSHYSDLMDATTDRLFFTEGIGEAKRLWLSDGTAEGTGQAYNVHVDGDYYKMFGTIDNRLVFSGAGAIRAVADTTKPDVLALIQVESGASAFGEDVAYFGSEGGPGIPDGLYRTDGSVAGTRLVAQIDVRNPDGINQVNIAGKTVFFEGFSDWNTGNRALFAFSESDDSLTRIADVVRDRQEHFVSGLADTQMLGTAGQQLLFRGWDAEHGFELWLSDGTEHGTRLLIDLIPGPNSSNPTEVFLSDGNVYFTADDGISGHELWVIPAVVLNTIYESESDPSGILVVEDAYPNPFQERTTLTVTTTESGPVLVRLFDAVGRQVATLFDGPIPSSGTLSLDVGGSSLGAGIYFVQVESRDNRQTVKLVHVK